MAAASIQKLPPIETSTVFCKRLVVSPPTTAYKWSEFRDPAVQIIGAIDVAKTSKSDDYYGILGEPTFVVGVDASKWMYIINQRSVILAGMADIGFFGDSLAKIGLPHLPESKTQQDDPMTPGAVFLEQLAVTEGDIIFFDLRSDGNVTMVHELGDGTAVKTKTYDLVAMGYDGHTIRFGVSSTPGYLMIVKLMKEASFMITTQQDGKSVMHATIHDIVDFSVADIYANDPDAPTPPVGGDSISNIISGAQVKCFDDGHIGLEGGIATKVESVLPVPAILLTPFQHTINVDSAFTTSITIPSIASGIVQGTEFVVMRSYSSQPGETWQLPHLTVNTMGGNMFEDGSTSIGVRPYSQVKVTAANDGGTWFVG